MTVPPTKESGTCFEEQHEKNMRILTLIRDDHGWALSRILLAEQAEADREWLLEALRNGAENGETREIRAWCRLTLLERPE